MPAQVPQRTRTENQRLGTREEFRLSHQEEDTLANQLDIEIECPRCRDVMELLKIRLFVLLLW